MTWQRGDEGQGEATRGHWSVQVAIVLKGSKWVLQLYLKQDNAIILQRFSRTEMSVW